MASLEATLQAHRKVFKCAYRSRRMAGLMKGIAETSHRLIVHTDSSPLGRSGGAFPLQNTVRQKFRFSSFPRLFHSNKALTADGRNAEENVFSLRRDPRRPLRLVRSEDFAMFLLADFVPKSYLFPAIRPSRGCGGGLVALQRRPRCNAVRALLQSREGLTGPHPGPPKGRES